MQSDAKKALTEMKQKIAKDAISYINDVLPKKTLELEKLAKDPILNRKLSEVSDLSKKDFEKIIASARCPSLPATAEHHTESCGCKRKRAEKDSGEMHHGKEDAAATEYLPSNAVIVESIELLKKELISMVEIVGTIKLWIQLNIPKIEDGNNFGVSIQEETVDELGRAEDTAFSGLEACSKYFLERAKIAKCIRRHPGMEDYVNALCETDQKEYLSLKFSMIDLRNNYAILYDMISKNIEKIERPRGSRGGMASIY